jgi:RNA polymerase sigma-70 factor, ECF subfamily
MVSPPTSTETQDLERAIRQAIGRRDYASAATLGIRGYGAEIYGFLLAFHRDEQDAAEVFSQLGERIWRDLPGFRQDSSFRTWAYVLARHASLNHRRDAQRRDRRQQPLPESSQVSALVAQVRSETASFLRSERRARFAAIRESLSPDDQALLVLRVDRQMAWNDLALVLHGGDKPPAGEALKREAARLRKRFQLLKERLLELGRAAGMVGGTGER